MSDQMHGVTWNLEKFWRKNKLARFHLLQESLRLLDSCVSLKGEYASAHKIWHKIGADSFIFVCPENK